MKVTQLYIYPIKSLQEVAVEEAILTSRGLQYDRRWMIVDDDGVFITRRKVPALARIQLDLTTDTIRIHHAHDPGVEIPLQPEQGAPVRPVKIWDTVCSAMGTFEEANIWLSRQLSMKCQLVYMPDSTRRPILSPKVPEGSVVSFADGYPILLIGQASLDDLNGRLPHPVTMHRFRPNIVVQTDTPFEEDRWSNFQIGAHSLTGVKPCSRCIMVNVDPRSGTVSKEPLRTLSSFRKNGGKVQFGLNVMWQNGQTEEAAVRVGDFVKP